jgi:putative Ca2+/H+ antiporter (TMEM165/GDT1 family)
VRHVYIYIFIYLVLCCHLPLRYLTTTDLTSRCTTAAGALAIMHVLSCVMGYALPALMPRAYTHMLGTALFAYFGLKLLYDAREVISR